MTALINLNALLKQTVVLTRENDDWTPEQIIAELLSNHVGIESLATISVGGSSSEKTGKDVKAKKTEKTETEKKTRTRSAPVKPRAIPEDDTRCSARSFYEKEHLEDGVLKVMRDDSDNLYGDRCKFKKTGDIDFCKHHSEKQPLGVWDSEYSGKFKAFVDKTENPSEAPVKKAKAKVVVEDDEEEEVEEVDESFAQQVDGSDEEEADAEDEEEEEQVPAKPAAKAAAGKPKIPMPVEPEEAEVEEIQIDKTTYLIDGEGEVYDPETEDCVGKYDRKTKKWLSKK
jgi:hypothetical protein